jgi:hypothetical protein
MEPLPAVSLERFAEMVFAQMTIQYLQKAIADFSRGYDLRQRFAPRLAKLLEGLQGLRAS